MTQSIKVEGLAQLQKELRQVDKDLPKQLRLANKSVAEFVAAAAKVKASSLGGVARKSAPSVKALAQQRNASVKIGGKKFGFAIGAEFGGGKFGKGNPKPPGGGYTTQFKPYLKLGRGGAGYFLYPTIREKSEEIIEKYGDAIDRLTKQAFPR